MRRKAIILSTFITAILASNNTLADVATENSISISKAGLDGIGEVIAHGASAAPKSFAKGSGYAAILSVGGNIAQKVTSIFVNLANDNRCKSTTNSYNNLQNACEIAPSFQKNQFCVVNVDNVGQESIRMETVKWNSNFGHLEKVLTRNDVDNKEQLCISRPTEPVFLEVYNSSNKKILSRPMPIDLFNGEFGGLVKNGKFYLKGKTEGLNSNLGYFICPSIMYNTPGHRTEDELATMCLNSLKEFATYQERKKYDELFKSTMKDTYWSSLQRQFSGKFDDEYIMRNASIDMETYEYSARIGGLFVLTSDTYAFIDPELNGGRKEGSNLDKVRIYNDFQITGHSLGDGPIVNMSSKVPQSVLQQKIEQANNRF
ncbi:TPA: hypothetical protein ACP5VG_004821 [Vibrio parahaemolyticus]